MPAMADDTGAAAAVEQLQQLQALGEPLLGPHALEGDRAGRSGRGGPDRSGAQPTDCGIARRQVDAAERPVLDDVPQDVGELQGHAEGVGQRHRPLAGRSSRTSASDRRPTEPATRRQ